MAHIKVISYEDSKGELREVYDDIIAKRGKLANVMQLQSHNPKSIVAHSDLYMELMFGRSPLSRYKREMLAVIVSVTNQCDYCIAHHGVALNHFWKDEAKVQSLKDDCESLDLSDEDKALCDYAKDLTLNASTMDSKSHTDKLRALGLDDRAIMDAALIISYFNFSNRMILGLGVAIDMEEVVGYNYD